MKLKISDDLSLPIDAATQTFAFVARKGAGKTYAAGKLVELLMEQHVQCVILDTVGNWYGLRLAADGKSRGFDIPVLGGLRGDIPLEAAGGELVADLVIETGRSLIIDVSQFSQGDRKRFATAFGIRLWQRKKAETHPSPLHLVIEESQLIIPQFVGRDDARMVGIYEEIIRLGRNYGIGVSMITQRPQSVNKEVLTQTECLVVLQVNGSPERKTLRDWIVHQGMDVKLLDELPSLPIGTAYLWSPQWLNVLQKIRIARKITYDGSATPRVGEKRHQRELTPLNLDAFKVKMATTIERAKENDPAELKRVLAGVRAELAKLKQSPPKVATAAKELPILSKSNEAAVDRLAKGIERAIALQQVGIEICKTRFELLTALRDLLRGLVATKGTPHPTLTPPIAISRASPHPVRPTPIRAASPASVSAPGEFSPSRSQQRILNAAAELGSIGINPAPKEMLAVHSLQRPTSGGYFNNLGTLRTAALIEYPMSGFVALTDAGLKLAAPRSSVSLAEFHQKWIDLMTTSQAAIARKLIEIYPNEISKDDLAEAVGQTKTSGGYFNNLGAMRTMGAIEYPRPGFARASQNLFPAGMS